VLTQALLAANEAVIGYVLERKDVADKVRKWLKRDPERLAFKAALSRVCITFTEHHPEWAAPFFNEQFLAHRAAPLLARCLTRHAPPDGAELAAIWAD